MSPSRNAGEPGPSCVRIALPEAYSPLICPDAYPSLPSGEIVVSVTRKPIGCDWRDSPTSWAPLYVGCRLRPGAMPKNDPEAGRPIRSFQLGIRRAGKAQSLVHHTGKDGDQRGHSSKEDVLDWSFRLDRPGDHDPASGARFILKFPKMRRHVEGLLSLDVSLVTSPITGILPGSTGRSARL